uniref:Galectin n=1 Tax=Globodera rostochiensis TaxID=31243 RepID=A0A914HIW4_GLORO
MAAAWIWKSVTELLPQQQFEIGLPHKRPVQGYPQTQRIRLEGVLFGDAHVFDINLKNGYTGQELFQFDPLFKRNYIQRKNMKKGDKEVLQGDLPYSHGKPFVMEVLSEGVKINIKFSIKDEPAYEFIANDNFKYVTVMELIGHFHIHTAKKQVPSIPVPHTRPFQGFTEGERITIKGSVYPGAYKGFSLDLKTTSGDSKYHFRPRFDQGHVVRNTMDNKVWGTPEIGGSFPFVLEKYFVLEVTIEGKIIKAYVDGELQSEFTIRSENLEDITYLQVFGDLQLNEFVVEPEEKLVVPYEMTLSGFLPPQKVRIIGTPKDGFSNYFQFRLDNGEEMCLYDFYPRFNRNVVGRDSQKKNPATGLLYWVNEETNGSFPFEIGRQFVVDLVAKDKLVIAYVDGRRHSEFVARDDLSTVTKIRVLNPDRIALESVIIGDEPGTKTTEDSAMSQALEDFADQQADQEKA